MALHKIWSATETRLVTVDYDGGRHLVSMLCGNLVRGAACRWQAVSGMEAPEPEGARR